MACPHIPTISYTEWCRRVYNKAENARIPLNGIIELTYRCSLRCVHCYVRDYPVPKELTCEEICLVIDQITEAGCLFLLLTGGEPLLRKDFLDIYLYAKKRGLLVTLFTNGALLTPEIADYLARYPPFTVEITLYGITEETYEKVTGIPGSLNRCLSGIDLLIERNIPLKLKTMVMTLNKHELWQMKKFAEKLDVDFRFDSCINPGLDGSKKPCQFRITPQEIVELDLGDEKRAREWKQLCENFWGTPITDERYPCAAGVTFFAINPSGVVKMCALLPPAYNIIPAIKESFLQGWNNIIPKILAEKRSQESACSHCQIFSICDRCAAYARLETGTPDIPIPFFCQIAGLRAAAFGSEERKLKLKMKGGFPYADKEKKDLPETVAC